MLKVLIFSILSLLVLPIQSVNARTVTFLWDEKSPDYPHFVVCDGVKLHDNPAVDSRLSIDLPVGFNQVCHIEVYGLTSEQQQVVISPVIEYRVRMNSVYLDRPCYKKDEYINGIKEISGRIQVGEQCGPLIDEVSYYRYHEVYCGVTICEAVE